MEIPATAAGISLSSMVTPAICGRLKSAYVLSTLGLNKSPPVATHVLPTRVFGAALVVDAETHSYQA